MTACSCSHVLSSMLVLAVTCHFSCKLCCTATGLKDSNQAFTCDSELLADEMIGFEQGGSKDSAGIYMSTCNSTSTMLHSV